MRLERVTFRYERDLAPAVEDLSLEVLPGERVHRVEDEVGERFTNFAIVTQKPRQVRSYNFV